MTEILPFDPMDHLTTDEDHAALLDDAFAVGDRAVIVHAIREIARARGMSDLSAQTGIQRSTLYKALSDDGNPTLDTVLKVMGAMKIQLGAKVAHPEALEQA